MQTEQSKKLEALVAVVEKVACPISAMKVSGDEIFCLAGVNCSKKGGEISLGNIPSDIENHCSKCPIKASGEKEIKAVVVASDENGFLACRGGGYVSPESCMGCAHLAVKQQMKIFEGMADTDVVASVACGFPRIMQPTKVFLKKKG